MPSKPPETKAAALSPLQALPQQRGTSSEVVALPWRLPRALPHTIYRCLIQGVKQVLLNTQKQTQGGCQIEKTKKHSPNKRREKNPRKRTKQNRDRIQKNEDSIRRLWDISKHANIQIIWVPEEEKEEQDIENLFEKIMKENFPNLAKEIDIQVQEAQRVPNKLDPKRTTPRHIIIKMPKIKGRERILKAGREKQRVTYKGVPIRLSVDFSKETCRKEGAGKKYSKS